jgi:DNA mismatch endonuclease (patch repair protein)
MVDVVDKATRSRMMSGIRGENTKPELMIRSALHKRGFRYRLHVASLPGKPDIVFKKYRAVIFVNGCFWHGHQCEYFKWPKTNRRFWKKKINGNIRRDAFVRESLKKASWRYFLVWECEIRLAVRRGRVDALVASLGKKISRGWG